ncbi:hypothetical protein Droror1_Dr00027882 [Drosera rotundifolia]
MIWTRQFYYLFSFQLSFAPSPVNIQPAVRPFVPTPSSPLKNADKYQHASTLATQLYVVLDDIFESRASPATVSRMSISINAQNLPSYALNDLLIAHPSPIAVS